jgi:hypothetical protein
MSDKFPMKNTPIHTIDHHTRVSAVRQIWDALHGYREDCIPEGAEPRYDEEWDYICEAMGVIHEELMIDQEDV